MSGSRVLALDYGTKRIGVALSDELGWTAQTTLRTGLLRTIEWLREDRGRLGLYRASLNWTDT